MHPDRIFQVAANLSAFGGFPLRRTLIESPRLREILSRFQSGTRDGDNGDGFPAYLRRAQQERVDVNDWIEQNLGWVPALPILEALVFPHLRPNHVVCEVGVGTGRWSRHILSKIPEGRLVLVDRSPWIVEFLRDYFRGHQNVEVTACNGVEIPYSRTEWADMVFSQGMFITLKLGHLFMYLREFARALKPGGLAIFDFIDPETPAGWAFLEREMVKSYDVFAYYSLASVAHACERAGFEVIGSQLVGKSTYLVTRKV